MTCKPVLLIALGVLGATPSIAQTPPSAAQPAPSLQADPTPSPAFPPGAEVLSVDGELLGVLVAVEARSGGERILHIRRADGSAGVAPSIVASRGERAVVLDWTRAEFESGQTAVPPPAEVVAAPVPRT